MVQLPVDPEVKVKVRSSFLDKMSDVLQATIQHRHHDFMTCGSGDMIFSIFELPVWTGCKGQSGVIFVKKMSQVLKATIQNKHYDSMTYGSGDMIFYSNKL